MLQSTRAKIIIVAGPTATGKSQLAIKLAKILSGEVVNLDSVQLYKDLSIGAAKISVDEMEGIPHHLFSICDPLLSFDVARYLREAEKKIVEIYSRGATPVFVGGTSLYITTLLHGLVDLPPSERELRIALEAKSTEELYKELTSRDAASAELLHPNDRNRIVRALEASLLSADKISTVKEQHAYNEIKHDALILVPMWARDELYQRIDQRSRKMMDDGLLEEVRALKAQYGDNASALKSIGYREVIEGLKSGSSLEKITEAISQNTRRFAKRQMTWLRNEPLKRGWEVSPTESDREAVLLEGDIMNYVHAKRLRHFHVLGTSFKELAERVKNELDHKSSGIKIWFLDAKRLV